MYDIMLQGRKQTKETFISKYLGQTWAEESVYKTQRDYGCS